jgi:hypothetical protein
MLFGVGLVSVGAAGVLAVAVMLAPRGAESFDIVAARETDIGSAPLHVQLPRSTDLAALARAERHVAPLGPRGATDPHAIYLIRDGTGAIRAYLAADPRTDCALEWTRIQTGSGPVVPTFAERFYDPCHGSLYDRNGIVVGGPSPWALDEAVLTIRDGTVYIQSGAVHAGAWLATVSR